MGEIFRLPDLGEGLREAEIVSWHVAEGDHVVTDQPLVSVETDKAVVEVPAPHAGHLERCFGQPGDVLAVGAPLLEFREGPASDAGAIVGTLAQPDRASPPETERPPGSSPTAHVRAAPAVRALARRLEVPLDAVRGTGIGDSVTRSDVQAAATPTGERLRGVRRAMLQNMARSGHQVVPATVVDEADIEGWAPHQDLTIRLVQAIVAGCQRSPSLNAWFDSERETRVLHSRVDLGIAVETNDGLFVPVLRDAATQDAGATRRWLDETKTAVEARTIARAELTGATITLSNFGMFGGRFADLVVVPPQVAILGAGRVQPQVRPMDGVPAIRRVVPLSLTFDHRVVTGVEAARFLRAVIEDLRRSE